MKKITDLGTEKALENCRVALENAESQPGVFKALEETGYDAETISQGKELLNKTRSVVDDCKIKRHQRNESYDEFYAKKEALGELFDQLRVKGKLVYRKNPAKIVLLGLNANVKGNYVHWITLAKKFFFGVASDETIQQDLARLKISMDDINAGIALIAEVETLRAVYVKRNGESQHATDMKKESLKVMNDWMYEFFNVAKIGLRDNPQLLEVLGKVVKS